MSGASIANARVEGEMREFVGTGGVVGPRPPIRVLHAKSQMRDGLRNRDAHSRMPRRRARFRVHSLLPEDVREKMALTPLLRGNQYVIERILVPCQGETVAVAVVP